MLREIRKGSPDAKVTLLIATGMHRPTTREELIEKFGDMTALVSSGVSTWAMTVRSQGKCEIVVADIGKNNQ